MHIGYCTFAFKFPSCACTSSQIDAQVFVLVAWPGHCGAVPIKYKSRSCGLADLTQCMNLKYWLGRTMMSLSNLSWYVVCSIFLRTLQVTNYQNMLRHFMAMAMCLDCQEAIFIAAFQPITSTKCTFFMVEKVLFALSRRIAFCLNLIQIILCYWSRVDWMHDW